MRNAVGHTTITISIDDSIPVLLREYTVGTHAEHMHFHAVTYDQRTMVMRHLPGDLSKLDEQCHNKQIKAGFIDCQIRPSFPNDAGGLQCTPTGLRKDPVFEHMERSYPNMSNKEREYELPP